MWCFLFQFFYFLYYYYFFFLKHHKIVDNGLPIPGMLSGMLLTHPANFRFLGYLVGEISVPENGSSEIFSRFQKNPSPVSKPKIRKNQEKGSIFYRKCALGVKNHISGLFLQNGNQEGPKKCHAHFYANCHQPYLMDNILQTKRAI